jgi:prepilin-type processing-associated H-X9-DG protein
VAAGGISPIQSGYKWSPNVTADFAIAADRNDGFTKKEDAAKVALLEQDALAPEQRQANSRNHEQAGQNVLFNDGHVEWAQTMWTGANKDGIYTAAKAVNSGLGGWAQLIPPRSKDTTTADPQIDLDTILMPKF